MESAVVELAEKGWGGLRTREVADRAGVNKALVHYHFGSIDSLRLEVVAFLMTDVVNEAASVLIEAPTLALGIRRFGETLDRFRSDDPGSVVLMEAMLHSPRDERLESILLRALAFYEEALRQRIETDANADRLPAGVDSSGLATALTALLDGLVLHAYMRPDVDFRPATDSIADLLDGRWSEQVVGRKDQR